MDFLIGLGIGFVIGWIVFKRPEWATKLIAWIKSKIWRQAAPPPPPAPMA